MKRRALKSQSSLDAKPTLRLREKMTVESVTERASELVGKFKSGRKDSSHKKHLLDFGMRKSANTSKANGLPKAAHLCE